MGTGVSPLSGFMRHAPRTPVILDARVVSGSGGGPDKTILNSPRFLTSAGYHMLCAYLRPPGDCGFARLREKATRWNAPLVEIDDRGPLDWRVVAELLRVCRRERVTIWHGHDYKSNALGLLLRRFWPLRLVTTVHGWVKHTRRTPLYYHIDRLCLPRYEVVICVSEDLREQCLAAGVPAARCVLLENAIDTEEFARTRDARTAKAHLGLDPDRLVIGAVGRLSAEKGFDILIRAVDQLVRDRLDVDLVILGDGADHGALRRLAEELGLADRVHLLGYRPDVLEWYQAMDVFALSSLREGLPNVVLEAMAVGTPVVATRVAGVPRLVRHEVNGLLVEPNRVAELAAALARVGRHTELRTRLGQAGRATVEQRYSFAARMDRLVQLYDRLLSRNGKPGLEDSGS